MRQQLCRFRTGLESRAATLLALLGYGCCAPLLVASTLAGFTAYEHAWPVAYDMAKRYTTVALITGCAAAVALANTSHRAGLAFPGATLLAGMAGVLAAAIAEMSPTATAMLPVIMFFVAGPTLIVAGARLLMSAHIASRFLAAIAAIVATSAGALGTLLAMGDEVDVLRIALLAAAFALLAIAAFMGRHRRAFDCISKAV